MISTSCYPEFRTRTLAGGQLLWAQAVLIIKYYLQSVS